MATPEPTTSVDQAYERLAGAAAILVGLGAIVYSVAFLGGVVLEFALRLGGAIASAAQMTGGILSVLVLVAIYRRLQVAAAPFALLGLLLAAAGAAGSTIHGGYMLANAIHPPIVDPVQATLPNPVDPRGLMTFGVSGLGLLVLMLQSRRIGVLPINLATLGAVVGILLLVIYLGRLIIVVPTNPLVAVPAALTGLVLSPAFYIWLGMELRRR